MGSSLIDDTLNDTASIIISGDPLSATSSPYVIIFLPFIVLDQSIHFVTHYYYGILPFELYYIRNGTK